VIIREGRSMKMPIPLPIAIAMYTRPKAEQTPRTVARSMEPPKSTFLESNLRARGCGERRGKEDGNKSEGL
jgi:hypothetical protein